MTEIYADHSRPGSFQWETCDINISSEIFLKPCLHLWDELRVFENGPFLLHGEQIDNMCFNKQYALERVLSRNNFTL